ncbi:four-carbon acid sugar kinase family protein [Jiangella ureilytica]|uniref:Four-carbon acid sugar kinase family protein n=1 Tax=Jiangella ureilytica TaxID=2530374 RepID=A0A4R4RN06_9ACTN|nr:four-carbon acid sugar kinase family protein [Jiangella ureilytica]TDC51107.1 four-carbon acid sugar kinase family protein [Jiangella ureilytica]
MTAAGFYGDDFTGSVDALVQFRRAGCDGVLVTSPDGVKGALGGDPDVVGIAGVARSLPAADLEAEVRPALELLRDLRVSVVQYKACSTADSSPAVGSLGRVVEIARDVFGPATVPALFAQPDFGRYTFFGHHFARDGERVHRLDRQPTMSRHPVTPMTEADLARHLGAQTTLPIGSLHWTAYAGGADAVARAWRETDAAAVVCDGFTDEHLELIGRAVLAPAGGDRQSFVLGAGGLSLGIGRALGRTAPPPPAAAAPSPGPTLVLSGSGSPRTAAQVAAAERAGWASVHLLAPGAGDEAVARHAEGAGVVVHTTRPGPGTATSTEIEGRLARIGAACLARDPRTRLVVCGGDTSGNVLRRLGVDALAVTALPWGNVALCHASGAPYARPVEVVLKGGQQGHDDLFDDVRTARPRRL